jgi:hypothetical protein
MNLKKIPLSGSTHGRPIKVTQTAIATGDTIHTALATTTDGEGDEIVLDAYNADSVERTLTIGWGGVSDPDDLIEFVLGAGERAHVVPGLFLRNGLVVKAAASAANVITIQGYVTRAQ